MLTHGSRRAKTSLNMSGELYSSYCDIYNVSQSALNAKASTYPSFDIMLSDGSQADGIAHSEIRFFPFLIEKNFGQRRFDHFQRD